MNPYRLLGCAALCTASLAHAGLRIETVTRDVKTGKEQSLQVMQVQDGMARMESNSGRNTASIFKNDTMYVLDAQRKTYTAIDRATLERTANTMGQAMEQMRAQMAAMPPERRAQMEQMMKQNGLGAMTEPAKTPVVDVKASGGSGTHQGKSCKLWDMTRDGAPSQQLCVVPFSALQGSNELRALAEKMQAWLAGMSGPLKQMIGDNPMQQSPDIANKLGGFPVITRQYKDGVLSSEETTVKTWQTQKIDAALFEIPAGYTKQEMPSMPAPKK